MQAKPKVLLVYTGGTIGMIHDPKTGALKAFDFEHLTKQIPELDSLNVSLESSSFESPIDSSEMNPKHWKEIAKTVFENYKQYDGFVILHGSDTMAYTASALSFMLQGLSKPVILTGSQLPIGTIRTDGKENLITAIEIAAAKDEAGKARIQEVAIYFEYSLYRGNRTSKISAHAFEAFSSPNFKELAVAGVSIEYAEDCKRNLGTKELELFTDFDTRVALLKIYPGFQPELYESIFDNSNVKAIVIETFGAGNAPSNPVFEIYIKNFIQAGGLVLNITQCNSGKVNQGKYETSSFFQKMGVLGGSDLTTEAALTKTMYCLGKYKTINEQKSFLTQNLVGEMSVAE